MAHINPMGIWPLVMAALWRREWHRPGRLPAWPFLIGAMGLGCFVLLPYAVVRREPAMGSPGVPAWVWGLLAAGSTGFAGWGLLAGDLGDWLHLARTDGFVFPMAWDFLAYGALFAAEGRGRLWSGQRPPPAAQG